MVAFFSVTINSILADLTVSVTFSPHSSPAFFADHCLSRYQDAFDARRSLFPFVAAIFPVGLAVTPLSAQGLVKTHVGARSPNVEEPFE